MNAAEKAALDRIRESLEEFPDSRMAQYVTAEDLKTLLRLIEKSTKKDLTADRAKS